MIELRFQHFGGQKQAILTREIFDAEASDLRAVAAGATQSGRFGRMTGFFGFFQLGVESDGKIYPVVIASFGSAELRVQDVSTEHTSYADVRQCIIARARSADA